MSRPTDRDHLPLTVLVPETSADPIVVYDQSAALRFAVAERGHVQRLGEQWDQPGNYILLDTPGADGRWGTYVGKAAPGGVRSRLMAHLRGREHWSRVVVIQRDTTYGFNSAQVGWLEGRLYDLMAAADLADLHNGNRPSDETLPPFDRAMLEACVLPIRRLLRLIGFDPATPDDAGVNGSTTSINSSRQVKFYGVKLVDMITAGVLEPGTVLQSTNNAWPGEAIVRSSGIEFEGQIYSAPSAAASAAKEGASANGWDHWAVETPTGKVTLSTLRARYQQSLATSSQLME